MERKLKEEVLDVLLDCLDVYTDGNVISEELATRLASARNHLQGLPSQEEQLQQARESMDKMHELFPAMKWNDIFLAQIRGKYV